MSGYNVLASGKPDGLHRIRLILTFAPDGKIRYLQFGDAHETIKEARKAAQFPGLRDPLIIDLSRGESRKPEFATTARRRRPQALFGRKAIARTVALIRCRPMLQPDVDPEPKTLRIYRCRFVSRCKSPRCREHATLVAAKIDCAGRNVRQIRLCQRHGDTVIESERARGLEISDRRNE